MDHVLRSIGDIFRDRIGRGARHYMEVSVGRQADRMGYKDLGETYRHVFAIVPLNAPQPGMKVRIDG